MLLPRVAIRYAKSLLQYAIETNETDLVLKDMMLVNKACWDYKDFNTMLSSPVVKSDKKQKIFNILFEDKIQKTSSKFFEIIIRKNREELIRDISAAYVTQYKEYKKIHTVHVDTAAPLNEENRKAVMDFLKSQTDEEIELIETIKEELIGGVVLRMKDVQFDASVKSNMVKLERVFSKEHYTIKI